MEIIHLEDLLDCFILRWNSRDILKEWEAKEQIIIFKSIRMGVTSSLSEILVLSKIYQIDYIAHDNMPMTPWKKVEFIIPRSVWLRYLEIGEKEILAVNFYSVLNPAVFNI